METTKQTNTNNREEEANKFLTTLQTLQEVNLELARTATLEELYRAAIELGRSRLGFDRLGLLLYDETTNSMLGTFGTDDEGEIRDERSFQQVVEEERHLEILSGKEKIGFWDNVDIQDKGETIGTGWNAMAVLWSGEKGIGWLAADNFLTRAPLDTQQLDILQLYGANLGHLVFAKQLEQQQKELLERRTRQVEISTQIAQAIASATDLEDLYERIVSEIKERFGYYHTQLLRYDPKIDAVELIAGYGEIGQAMKQQEHKLPMGQGLIGTAAKIGTTVLRPNLTDDPDWQPNPLLPETKGEIAVPIKLGNQILGVIDVQSNIIEALNENDQLLLEGLCGQIAVAIDTTRLITVQNEAEEALVESQQTLQRFVDQRRILHDLSLQLAEAEDLDTLYYQAVELGKSELGFDRLGLFILDKSQTAIVGTFGIDTEGQIRDERDYIVTFEEDDRFREYIFNEERLLITENVNLIDSLEDVGQGWQLTAALWRENKPIGLLFADNLFTQEPLSSTEPEILSAYAATVANIIDRMQTETVLRESEQTMQAFLEKQQQLHEIGLLLSNIEDPDELYREAIKLGRDKLGFSRLGLYLLDEETEIVHGTYGIWIDGTLRKEYDQIHNLATDTWLHRYLYDKERLSVSEDIDLHEDGEVVGHGWSITAALWSLGKLIGLLFADNLLNQEPLQSYQSELLSAFGSTIANIIDQNRAEKEQERLLKDTEQQAEDLAQLNKLSTAINQAQTLHEIYQLVGSHTTNIIGGDRASLALVTAEGDTFEVFGLSGIEGAIPLGMTLPIKGTAVGVAIKENRLTSFPQDGPLDSFPDTKKLAADGVHCTMTVPLVISGQVEGTINVGSKIPDTYDERKKTLMLQVGNLVASAMQVKREQGRTETILQSVTVPMLISRVRDGQIHYANEQLANLIRIPLESLIGNQSPNYYVHTEDRTTLIERIQKDGQFENYELLLQRNDGDQFWALISARIIEFEGEPAIISTIIDITDRKETQTLLEEREEELQTLLEYSPDAIGLVNVETGLFETTNVGAEKLYGLDHEGLQKVGPIHMSPEFQPDGSPSGEMAMKNIKKAIDHGQSSFEWIHINAGGEEIPCEINLVGLPGTRSHLVRFSATDITQRKQAQALITKQATELQTVADLSTQITSIQDPQALMDLIVQETRERFQLYHCHIFLVDESGKNLGIRACGWHPGAPENSAHGGSIIPLNAKQSLVAQAARTRQAVVINNVLNDPNWLPNEMLPDTRSELAVPMIVGDTVIGVLDVQSTEVDQFSSDDIKIQSTFAAQIAVALENARSLKRSQQAVEELDKLTRRLTRESWEDYLTDSEQEDTEFVYSLSELTETDEIDEVTSTNGHLSHSLMVHGEAIGHLTVFNESEEKQLDADAALIMAAIAEQLSARVENIRLTDQTQQALAQTQDQAQRLGMLNEISAEMSNVDTLNQVFNVIFERIPELLNVDRVSMAMLRPDGESLEVIGFEGVDMEAPTGTIVSLSGTIMERAIKENMVVGSDTISSEGSLKSSMVAPLSSSGRIIGTLNIGSKKANALTSKDETLMRQLATMLSSVIDNKQLLAAAQARAERERQVRTITDKIRRGVDREAILNIAQEEIRSLIGAKQSAAQLGTKAQLLERIQQTQKES